MSLKKRILSFFTAFLMIFGSTPFVFENASATDGDSSAPEHSKTITDNGDGTYTITLSVTGKSESTTTNTKANVVVVLDTSGSMSERECLRYTGSGFFRRCAEYSTRLQVAKNAVNSLAEDLLENNTTSGVSDMVEIALVDFSSNVNSTSAKTTSLSTVNSWVNGRTANGGTNWEAALKTANEFSFNDNDPTYIIFVSDGNPTFRLSSHEYTQQGPRPGQSSTVSNPDENGYNDIPSEIHGNGRNDNYGWNLSDAQAKASEIISSGKSFYAVGAFGDADNMKSLGGTYYDATDSEALEAAFSDIVSQITNSLSVTDILFSDGITGETTAAITGSPSDFVYKKNGETWEDAPKATYSEATKTVEWNLGDTVVKNGETVTVSFIVWPSQEVLDLVADLENEKKTWEDDVVGTKYESEINRTLLGDGSYKYTLKTNTDSPTLTYSTLTTVTENGETTTEKSEPKTVPIENPDPVDLTETKLTIRKIWEDGLDPSQRADYQGEVILDLYKADEIYEDGIKLNEATDWKLDNYLAIAPGIMVSESHEAYTHTNRYTQNKEYAILDEGHDYHFKEENITNHFNLTDSTYHPMLVDGTLMNVSYHREDGGIVIDSMTELTEITATNTIKGGALIEKILVGNDEKTTAYSSDTFKFNAELKNPDGDDYDFTYRIYYGKSNPKNYNETAEEILTNEDGTKTYRSDKRSGSGSLEIQLYGGDRVMFTDVETGTYFWADEDDSNLKLGYEQLEEKFQIVRNGGDAETNAKTKEFDGKTFYAIEGNASTQYVAKNIHRTGELEFTKTVEVENGNEEQAKATEFDFEVNFYDKDGSKLEVSPDWGGGIVCKDSGFAGQPYDPSEMTMGDGCKGSVIGLPAGATYEIIETEKDGFTAEGLENGKVVKTGTIEAGKTATESFVNTYNATGTAEFTVTKQFGLTENPFWMIQDDFKFVLKDESGRQIGEAKTIDKLTHSATFEIEIEKEGDYTYEVEELDDNFKTGVARKDNDTNVIVTFKATDNGKGELVVSDLTYKNSKDTIYNSYTVEEELEDALKFKKVFSDEGADYEGGAEFDFTVSMSEGAPKPSNLNENGTFTLKNNEEIDLGSISFSETDIPAEGKTYTYTISESSENLPDGVSIVSGEVKITVNVKFNQETGKLDVTTNQYETEFVNIFQPTDGKEFSEKLEIEKAIKDLTNSKVDGEFSFKLEELKNDEYEEIETITLATEDLAGSAKFNERVFEETGTHYYRISEIAGEANGFSYDDTVYEITVKVTEEDGKLVAEYSGIPEDGIKFTNVYEAEATKLNFGIYKEVDNLTSDAEVETFEFELKNEDGETIATTEIEGEGEGEFSNIEFTQVGTYTFTVSEVNTGAEYYEYDETVYEIIVSIVDENGKLKLDGVTILKSEEEVGEIVFTNVYENPGRGEVEEEEEVVEENPYTNDNIAFFVSLYILSLIGFIGAVVYARKEV